MWDMMSRGSFNGPGGQHTRWQIPPTQGGALGAQHNLRNKRFLNFITDTDILRLNRDGLAQTGLAVAEVKAREVAPDGELAGVRVLLNGAGDTNPPCRWPAPTRRCEGPWYTSRRPATRSARAFNDYTIEVVQQIGSDSFVAGPRRPDRQDQDRQLDLRLVQLLRLVHRLQPAGHQPGRLRQGRRHAGQGDASATSARLNDGSFNVGLNSGSTYEYKAAGNNLHFYILDKRTDADGILRYTVGVRSLAGSGPQTRGVSLGTPTVGRRRGLHDLHVPAQEHGRGGGDDPALHPQDASAYLNSDIYRLSASTSATGWEAHLKNALATAKFGETVQVPVYIAKAAGAAASGSVTLTATSESDPTKTMSATCGTDGGRRRHRAGDAVAEPGHAGELRRVHARACRRTTSPPPRRTSSRPPVTRR